MVQALTIVDDLAASIPGRLTLNQHERNRVEITGLDLLNSGNIAMPESLETMSFSDDSSTSDISYANDSVELTRHGIRGRMSRRLSNDSYANDSVDVAKNKKLQSKPQPPKDTVPLKHVAINIKLSARQMDVKNIVVPSSVSPDLAGLKPMTISNHAA
jgi:hypothetical protein